MAAVVEKEEVVVVEVARLDVGGRVQEGVVGREVLFVVPTAWGEGRL